MPAAFAWGIHGAYGGRLVRPPDPVRVGESPRTVVCAADDQIHQVYGFIDRTLGD